MNNTLLSSYSGIKTHQFGIDSISNNIANVNTTGYRESRPEFETLFAVSPNTSPTSPTANDINLGVTASSNAFSTKSGSYRVSDGDFHMAYQGKGWFVVGEKSDGEMVVGDGKLSAKQENFFSCVGSLGKIMLDILSIQMDTMSMVLILEKSKMGILILQAKMRILKG